MGIKLDFDDLIHRKFLPANYKSLDMFEQHLCLQTLLSNRRLCLEAFGTKNPMNVIYMTTRPKSKNYRQENVAAKIDKGNDESAAGALKQSRNVNKCTAAKGQDKTSAKTCDVESLVDNNEKKEEYLQSENIQEARKRGTKKSKKEVKESSKIAAAALKQTENDNKPTIDNVQEDTPINSCDVDVNLNGYVEHLVDNNEKKKECLQSENIHEAGKARRKKAKKRAEETSKATGKRKARRKTKLNGVEYRPIASSTLTDSVRTISSLPALKVNDNSLLSAINLTKQPEKIPINALPGNLAVPQVVSVIHAKPSTKRKSTMPGKKLKFATPLIDNMSDTAEKQSFEIDDAILSKARVYPASLKQATLANILNIQKQENVAAKIDKGNDESAAGALKQPRNVSKCTADNGQDKTSAKTCDVKPLVDDNKKKEDSLQSEIIEGAGKQSTQKTKKLPEEISKIVAVPLKQPGNDDKSTIDNAQEKKEECLQSENIQKAGKRGTKKSKKEAKEPSKIAAAALKQTENDNKPTIDNVQEDTPINSCDVDVNLNGHVEHLVDNNEKKECPQSENIHEAGKVRRKKAKKRAGETSKATGKRKARRKTKLNGAEYRPIASSTLTDSVTTTSSLPALKVNDNSLLSAINLTKQPVKIPINAMPGNLAGPPVVSFIHAKPSTKRKSTMPGKKLKFATPLIDNMSDTAEKQSFEIDDAILSEARVYPASLRQATLANILNIQEHISRKYLALAPDDRDAEKPKKRFRRTIRSASDMNDSNSGRS